MLLLKKKFQEIAMNIVYFNIFLALFSYNHIKKHW